MEIFCTRLKELRQSAGLTQQQMADKLNIRQQSYARYEYGNSEPSLEMLVQIAGIFKVSTEYLLGVTDY